LEDQILLKDSLTINNISIYIFLAYWVLSFIIYRTLKTDTAAHEQTGHHLGSQDKICSPGDSSQPENQISPIKNPEFNTQHTIASDSHQRTTISQPTEFNSGFSPRLDTIEIPDLSARGDNPDDRIDLGLGLPSLNTTNTGMNPPGT
jgi:hypothetical protein